MPVALQARAVSRSFRGFRALDRVDLSVEEGEIHAILGPNGAGKTTLFNCLSGFLQPSEGTVELFGETIAGLPPHRIADRITVLARGQVLAAGSYEQIRNDARVIEAYLGEEVRA